MDFYTNSISKVRLVIGIIALQLLACLLSSVFEYFEKRSEYYVHHY